MPSFAVAALFVTACNSTPTEGAPATQPAVDELAERYVAIRDLHDEVMPARGALIRQQRALRDRQQDPSAAVAYRRLERADSMMMTWMRTEISLDSLRASLSDAEIATHLDRRAAEMQAVDDSMRVSMAFAKTLLAE